MRLIGSLSEEKQAQLFTDYLLSHDIRAEVEQDDSQWSVWVKDEDKLSLARGCLEEFRADPAAPRFREAATQAVALRQEDERRRHTQAKQTVDVRRDLWSQPTARRAPLTMVLAIACVVVAMASNMGQNRRSQMVRALAFADPVQRISKRGRAADHLGRHSVRPSLAVGDAHFHSLRFGAHRLQSDLAVLAGRHD